jgi:hypothetical protein
MGYLLTMAEVRGALSVDLLGSTHREHAVPDQSRICALPTVFRDPETRRICETEGRLFGARYMYYVLMRAYRLHSSNEKRLEEVCGVLLDGV